MSEADLQRAILDAALWLGWLSYHTYDSRRCSPGFPDLVLVHPTRGCIFAELKGPRGRLRPEQIQWVKTLRLAGSEVYVWRPDDLDEAIERLRGKK